jgi:peptidoglycan/LPS O-acetylase OafA/YrhL
MINLVLGAGVAGCIRFAIRLQPLEALGRNSYSMYLSHFAVIFGLRQIWPLADGLVSLLIAYVVTAALSYLVARATWHLVERHAQDLAHRLTSATTKAARAEPVTAAGIALNGRSAGA